LEADDVQIAALGEIRSAGVLLALDDFGTAYSSLNHLRQFPVDVVKIDRSFIAGICHDPADMAIVRAVVDLSRTFGFRVVAEGVETADQLDQQRRLGCNAAQGYLIGRPRPAAEFGRMLASRPLLDLLMARRTH
jgi:diguanylate cyclase